MKRLAFAGLLAASAVIGLVAVNAQTTTDAGGMVHFGSFGLDEAGMDKSVPPGDDFYGYANGTWTKTTVIPEDKSSYGSFDMLADLSRARTRGILQPERAADL